MDSDDALFGMIQRALDAEDEGILFFLLLDDGCDEAAEDIEVAAEEVVGKLEGGELPAGLTVIEDDGVGLPHGIVSPDHRAVGVEHQAELGVHLTGAAADGLLLVVIDAVGEYHDEDHDEHGRHDIGRQVMDIGNGVHILLLGKRLRGHYQ